MTLLVNRVILAVTGGFMLVASALLLAAVTPSPTAGTPVLEVLGYVGLAVGTVRVLRVFARRRARRLRVTCP